MNSDGTAQTRLTFNTFPVFSGWSSAWSPDGSKIAFYNPLNGTGNDDIYLMNADGTNKTRITTYAGYDRDPAWSPDGSKIAFGSWMDGNSDIFIMNPDGTERTRLTFNTIFDGEPDWSPDGSKIVFTSIGTIITAISRSML